MRAHAAWLLSRDAMRQQRHAERAVGAFPSLALGGVPRSHALRPARQRDTCKWISVLCKKLQPRGVARRRAQVDEHVDGGGAAHGRYRIRSGTYQVASNLPLQPCSKYFLRKFSCDPTHLCAQYPSSFGPASGDFFAGVDFRDRVGKRPRDGRCKEG